MNEFEKKNSAPKKKNLKTTCTMGKKEREHIIWGSKYEELSLLVAIIRNTQKLHFKIREKGS